MPQSLLRKNQKRENVKGHHYIISFDLWVDLDNGLTVDWGREKKGQPVFDKESAPMINGINIFAYSFINDDISTKY